MLNKRSPQDIEKGNLDNFKLSTKTKDVLRSLGYSYLFPIQAETFNIIFKGKNLVGKDRTGSGKTLAFTLPILELERVCRQQNDYPRELRLMILVPTRELAIQIGDCISKIQCHPDEFKVVKCYGGTNIHEQIDAIRKGVDIIVGTPGRIKDLLERKKIHLKYIKYFILDETDEMLNQGFRDDIIDIVGQVKHRSGQSIQYLLFSATIPYDIQKFIEQNIMSQYEYIDLIKDDKIKTSTTVQHFKLSCQNYEQKIASIVDIIRMYAGPNSKTIIFAEKKTEANEVYTKTKKQLKNDVIHGDVPQKQRETVIKNFSDGSTECLIATNVAARGLDFPTVDLIVQLQPSKDIDAYVH